MKKLFVLLLAAGLIGTSCNNNKEKSPGDNPTSKDKDNYLNGNDENNGLFGKDDNTNENNNNEDYGDWSSSDVRKFNDECETSLKNEGLESGMVDQICSCWFDKVKRKYSSFKEADSDHSGAHEQMIKDCATKIAGASKTNIGDDDNDNNMSGGWSSTDKNNFMRDCKSTAVEKVGQSRANSYCSCMLNKLEGMYSSYSEADRKLANITEAQLNSLVEDCNR